jgi:hypothetical protein
MLGSFSISFASDDLGVDVIPVLSAHEDAAAPMWVPVEQALEKLDRSLDGLHIAADGQRYLTQIKSYPTGSGKTNVAVREMEATLEKVARGDLDGSEPFFTPRAIVRLVSRAVDSSNSVGAGPDAEPLWSPSDLPRCLADEPELNRSGRRFSDPRPVSASEDHVSRATADVRSTCPPTEPLASPPRRLDRVRRLIAAILRTLTPALKRRAHTTLSRLSCLLAARRLWRAVVPAVSIIVPAGARAAAVRGGPRGPDRFLQSTCHTFVSRALGGA